MATMDQSQSFDGRESEILFNPALIWTMQQFPNHTKGEILFFMLPLHVRHRIYDYHSFQHDSSAKLSIQQKRTGNELRTPPRKPVPPLAQTCQTFRREMKGLKGSRAAIFKDETGLHGFLKVIRQRALTPFVSTITLDLGAPQCQIRTLDTFRSFFVAASKQLTNINWLNIDVRMVQQRVASPLKTLMRDGTLARFTHLEEIKVRDQALQTKFRACDKQRKEFIRAKIAKWTALRRIDENIAASELLMTAACMARLEALNLELKLIMREWRRDSAVDVDAMDGVVMEMSRSGLLGLGGDVV